MSTPAPTPTPPLTPARKSNSQTPSAGVESPAHTEFVGDIQPTVLDIAHLAVRLIRYTDPKSFMALRTDLAVAGSNPLSVEIKVLGRMNSKFETRAEEAVRLAIQLLERVKIIRIELASKAETGRRSTFEDWPNYTGMNAVNRGALARAFQALAQGRTELNADEFFKLIVPGTRTKLEHLTRRWNDFNQGESPLFTFDSVLNLGEKFRAWNLKQGDNSDRKYRRRKNAAGGKKAAANKAKRDGTTHISKTEGEKLDRAFKKRVGSREVPKSKK